MIILKESKRDDLLQPYVDILNSKGIKCTTGILKKYLLRHLTENGGLNNLSLGSNFYLAGAAKYYFNGDLTVNKDLDVFNNGTNNDIWKTDICERLNALILILRNGVIDSLGEKFEQPEDFGELPIAKLLRKYGAKINKELGIETPKKTKTVDKEIDNLDRSNTVGNGYTFDILYSYNDARKYNTATSPGAWCITSREGHYDAYRKRLGIHYVIFRKDGWENVERIKGPEWTTNKPQDEYGCSLIALLQSNTNGEPIYITSRWNHGHISDNSHCEADHAFTKEEFFQKTGINDNDLQRIFQIWKKDNTDGKRTIRNAKTPEERAESLKSLRDLKYRQMRINGGENPDFALIDRERDMSNEQYAVKIANCKNTLLGNGKPSNSIAIYKVNLGGNEYAILVDRGQIIFETLTPFSLYRSSSYYAKTFDYTESEKGSEFRWIKNAIVYRKNDKFMIYCINQRKFLDIGGVNKFKYLDNTRTYNVERANFYEIKLSNNQNALVDITTNKPLRLPNGEYWSDEIRWEGKNTYYGRQVKPCLVGSDVDYIIFTYDSAAGTVYFYDVKQRSFMDVDLSEFRDTSRMVIRAANIASDPEIKILGNDGFSYSDNKLYLIKNNEKVTIGGLPSFNYIGKLSNTNVISIGIMNNEHGMKYYFWESNIQSYIMFNDKPLALSDPFGYTMALNTPNMGIYIKYKDSNYIVYVPNKNLLLINPHTNNIFFNPPSYNMWSSKNSTIIYHRYYDENYDAKLLEFQIEDLIEHHSIECTEPYSAPLIYENEDNNNNNNNTQRNEPMLSFVNENNKFSLSETKFMVKEIVKRILKENRNNELDAFHGSASNFNKFDLSYVGTGEGSQVYGYGVYLTDVKDTGRWYAATIAIKNAARDSSNFKRSVYKKIRGIINGKTFRQGLSPETYDEAKKIMLKTIEDNIIKAKRGGTKKEWEKAAEIVGPLNTYDEYMSTMNKLAHEAATPYERYVYEVDIPDSGYIDWNETDENFLRKIYQKFSEKFDTSHVDINKVISFGDLYEKLRGWRNKNEAGNEIIPQKNLSLYLYSLGFKGIRVPTGNKNGGDGRGQNFVIFNDRDVEIKNIINMAGKEDF